MPYAKNTQQKTNTEKKVLPLSQMHGSSENEYITAPVLLINILRLRKQFYSLFSKNKKG